LLDMAERLIGPAGNGAQAIAHGLGG